MEEVEVEEERNKKRGVYTNKRADVFGKQQQRKQTK